MKPNNLLIVEDDKTLGYALKEYLELKGFNVIWAKNGKIGFELFSSNNVDLCILDIMMPEEDGFSLAKRIKEFSPDIPLIFLTAKSMKIDKLKAFNIGADDYIIKPVDEEELVARIKAVIRRSIAENDDKTFIYYIGKYIFDFKLQTLDFKGSITKLSSREAELLKLLVQKKGKILERKQTLKEIWNLNDYFNRRTMDVYISRLRKLLAKDPDISIVNVHGKGFVLRD